MFICEFACFIGIFLNSAYLICRSMDISKCFRGSLRLRDNESRLYMNFFQLLLALCFWPIMSHIVFWR